MPGFGAAQILPSCRSMMERLIDSPIPIPPGLVVKKASKSWSTLLWSKPRDPTGGKMPDVRKSL